jgi:hypothetical protein
LPSEAEVFLACVVLGLLVFLEADLLDAEVGDEARDLDFEAAADFERADPFDLDEDVLDFADDPDDLFAGVLDLDEVDLGVLDLAVDNFGFERDEDPAIELGPDFFPLDLEELDFLDDEEADFLALEVGFLLEDEADFLAVDPDEFDFLCEDFFVTAIFIFLPFGVAEFCKRDTTRKIGTLW